MSASAALTLGQGVAQLAAVVGEEHTRLCGETAQTIEVAPGDIQQVAEILRFAYANALSVMPRGGGTKVGWGNTFSSGYRIEHEASQPTARARMAGHDLYGSGRLFVDGDAGRAQNPWADGGPRSLAP